MTDQKPSFHRLSPLDMLMPRMHVPKLLYFSSSSEPGAILATLRAALALTIEAIPIISGSIALSEHQNDQQGSLSVQRPHLSAEQILSSNDLREIYDFETLRASHFPSNAIPLAEYAPKSFGDSAESMPVMMAQANFLRGGLLLFFAIHHCVMDEMGFFNVMRVWAACARGDTDLDFISPQWFDREPLMQGSGTGRLGDHPEYTLSLEGAATKATEDPSVFYPTASSEVESAVFFLSNESLARLKAAATRLHGCRTGEQDVQENACISTNDALIALFWCSITSARISESIEDENVFPRFGMAVNGRDRLRPPIPPDYTGNVVLIAKTVTSARTLLPSDPDSLVKAALLVRRSINDVDDAYIRDTIQLVRSVKDLGQLAPRRRPAVEHSLGCSSWARQPYYSLDWGNLIGDRCERVRWRSLRTDGLFMIFPRLPQAEGTEGMPDRNRRQKRALENLLWHLWHTVWGFCRRWWWFSVDMPNRKPLNTHGNGGVEVLLGLKTDHMRRLKEDDTFTQFAEWRCN
ncbi:hypothetical protein N7G274_008614 [Stereocaulon virgatum]|uniref:Uncharacterized protein n=1 Tax=Stereocaulon virgatum TaxID=373712 RepID=A0ABR4A0Q5_9LECA